MNYLNLAANALCALFVKDASSTGDPRLILNLPLELLDIVVSHITKYQDIVRFKSVNRYTRITVPTLVRTVSTHNGTAWVGWNSYGYFSNFIFHPGVVNRLPELRRVEGVIELKKEEDVELLASSKLMEFALDIKFKRTKALLLFVNMLRFRCRDGIMKELRIQVPYVCRLEDGVLFLSRSRLVHLVEANINLELLGISVAVDDSIDPRRKYPKGVQGSRGPQGIPGYLP